MAKLRTRLNGTVLAEEAKERDRNTEGDSAEEGREEGREERVLRDGRSEVAVAVGRDAAWKLREEKEEKEKDDAERLCMHRRVTAG